VTDKLESPGVPAPDSIEVPEVSPVIPLRDLVVFPYLVAPISVGRPGSIQALDEAIESNRKVVLLSQRDSKVESPGPADLFQIGTLSIILRMARLENEVRVLAQVSHESELKSTFRKTITSKRDRGIPRINHNQYRPGSHENRHRAV